MEFNGYTKTLGAISTALLVPIRQKLKNINWDDINYSRDEEPLVRGKLIEMPFELAFKKTQTEQALEIVKLCEPIVETVQKYFPNCIKVRGEIATMVPGGAIDFHIDRSWFHEMSHRIHVPIVTNEKCSLLWEQPAYREHLPIGYIYEINNRRYHSAENLSTHYRTHLIMDFCDQDTYSKYVASGANVLTVTTVGVPMIMPYLGPYNINNLN